jgi:hypothetical protein
MKKRKIYANSIGKIELLKANWKATNNYQITQQDKFELKFAVTTIFNFCSKYKIEELNRLLIEILRLSIDIGFNSLEPVKNITPIINDERENIYDQ